MEVKQAYKLIERECNPKNTLNHMMNTLYFKKTSNFSGGSGDLMTKHETMFHLMNPDLQAQVSFGSGKGGYEKWGFKKVTVDFLDVNNHISYEIDGVNHQEHLQKLKDRIKAKFLKDTHGIKTIRITNEQVEELVMKHLEKLKEQGVLKQWLI